MCDEVDTAWGAVCPRCGQRLPNPPRVKSWKSQRALAFASGSSAGLGDRGTPRNPASTLQAIATRRANREAKGDRR